MSEAVSVFSRPVCDKGIESVPSLQAIGWYAKTSQNWGVGVVAESIVFELFVFNLCSKSVCFCEDNTP